MNAKLQADLARCRVAAEIIRGLDAQPSSHRAVCDALLPLPDPNAAPAVPAWVQIASAGDYKGYSGGAFVFDEAVFTQILVNFHSNPSYVPGADGIGMADVIPRDFNHASASFPADGSVPITGTPAQGWVRELQMRPGADGLQLWAFTNWLEPARTYIREKRYQWASVVVGFDCRDPETGANIGAVLESVALTNNPFIEGMQKLAASRGGTPSQQQGNTMQPPKLTLTLPRGVAPGSTVATQLGNAALALAMQHRDGTTDFTTNDLNNDGAPDWKPPPGLNATRWAELLTKARAAGINGVAAPTALAWLRAQGADVVKELGLDDPGRAPIVVGHLLLELAAEAKPVGTNDPPVHPIVPAGLSRTSPLDARNHNGRNRTERAVLALRGHSPRFAALSFGEQIAQAGEALRAGAVLA